MPAADVPLPVSVQNYGTPALPKCHTTLIGQFYEMDAPLFSQLPFHVQGFDLLHSLYSLGLVIVSAVLQEKDQVNGEATLT